MVELRVDFFTNSEYGSLRIDGGSGFNSLVIHKDLGSRFYFNDYPTGPSSSFVDENNNTIIEVSLNGDNPFGPYSSFFDRNGNLVSQKYRIENINLIDLQNSSTLTISVTDIDNIVAADSNGINTLFVNGTTAAGGFIIGGGESISHVALYNAPSGFSFNSPTSTVSMGTLLYDSYQIDSNTVLNIQQGVGRGFA